MAPGQGFGLLGPNGAGKTTAIGMLNTTVTPASGRALLGGFVAAALVLCVLMYGLAEVISVRLRDSVEITGSVPAVAMVPFFFAGSLFPVTALPHRLEAVARVLSLTHAPAMFRYGLTGRSGVVALHHIWELHNASVMASLSMGVLVLYAAAVLYGAVRLFTRAGTS